jgi:hypothetical protein
MHTFFGVNKCNLHINVKIYSNDVPYAIARIFAVARLYEISCNNVIDSQLHVYVELDIYTKLPVKK